jgi:ABC-type microcin C transport system permease subunit YejB
MMVIKGIDLQLLKTEKREGMSKTQKPYLFYVSKFIDENGDMILLKLGNEMLKDEKLISKLMSAVNIPVTISLGLYPSGFTFKGIALSIDI